jgi:hypothetical protein
MRSGLLAQRKAQQGLARCLCWTQAQSSAQHPTVCPVCAAALCHAAPCQRAGAPPAAAGVCGGREHQGLCVEGGGQGWLWCCWCWAQAAQQRRRVLTRVSRAAHRTTTQSTPQLDGAFDYLKRVGGEALDKAALEEAAGVGVVVSWALWVGVTSTRGRGPGCCWGQVCRTQLLRVADGRVGC